MSCVSVVAALLPPLPFLLFPSSVVLFCFPSSRFAASLLGRVREQGGVLSPPLVAAC